MTQIDSTADSISYQHTNFQSKNYSENIIKLLNHQLSGDIAEKCKAIILTKLCIEESYKLHVDDPRVLAPSSGELEQVRAKLNSLRDSRHPHHWQEWLCLLLVCLHSSQRDDNNDKEYYSQLICSVIQNEQFCSAFKDLERNTFQLDILKFIFKLIFENERVNAIVFAEFRNYQVINFKDESPMKVAIALKIIETYLDLEKLTDTDSLISIRNVLIVTQQVNWSNPFFNNLCKTILSQFVAQIDQLELSDHQTDDILQVFVKNPSQTTNSLYQLISDILRIKLDAIRVNLVYYNLMQILIEKLTKKSIWLTNAIDISTLNINNSSDLKNQDNRERLLYIFQCRVVFMVKIAQFIDEQDFHCLNKDVLLFLFKKINSQNQLHQKNKKLHMLHNQLSFQTSVLQLVQCRSYVMQQDVTQTVNLVFMVWHEILKQFESNKNNIEPGSISNPAQYKQLIFTLFKIMFHLISRPQLQQEDCMTNTFGTFFKDHIHSTSLSTLTIGIYHNNSHFMQDQFSYTIREIKERILYQLFRLETDYDFACILNSLQTKNIQPKSLIFKLCIAKVQYQILGRMDPDLLEEKEADFVMSISTDVHLRQLFFKQRKDSHEYLTSTHQNSQSDKKLSDMLIRFLITNLQNARYKFLIDHFINGMYHLVDQLLNLSFLKQEVLQRSPQGKPLHALLCHIFNSIRQSNLSDLSDHLAIRLIQQMQLIDMSQLPWIQEVIEHCIRRDQLRFMYDLSLKDLDETLLGIFLDQIYMNKDLVRKMALSKIFKQPNYFTMDINQLETFLRKMQKHNKINQQQLFFDLIRQSIMDISHQMDHTQVLSRQERKQFKQLLRNLQFYSQLLLNYKHKLVSFENLQNLTSKVFDLILKYKDNLQFINLTQQVVLNLSQLVLHQKLLNTDFDFDAMIIWTDNLIHKLLVTTFNENLSIAILKKHSEIVEKAFEIMWIYHFTFSSYTKSKSKTDVLVRTCKWMFNSYSYLKNDLTFKDTGQSQFMLKFQRFFFDIDNKEYKSITESKHLKIISDQSEYIDQQKLIFCTNFKTTLNSPFQIKFECLLILEDVIKKNSCLENLTNIKYLIDILINVANKISDFNYLQITIEKAFEILRIYFENQTAKGNKNQLAIQQGLISFEKIINQFNQQVLCTHQNLQNLLDMLFERVFTHKGTIEPQCWFSMISIVNNLTASIQYQFLNHVIKLDQFQFDAGESNYLCMIRESQRLNHFSFLMIKQLNNLFEYIDQNKTRLVNNSYFAQFTNLFLEITNTQLIIAYNMYSKFQIKIKFGDINWLKIAKTLVNMQETQQSTKREEQFYVKSQESRQPVNILQSFGIGSMKANSLRQIETEVEYENVYNIKLLIKYTTSVYGFKKWCIKYNHDICRLITQFSALIENMSNKGDVKSNSWEFLNNFVCMVLNSSWNKQHYNEIYNEQIRILRIYKNNTQIEELFFLKIEQNYMGPLEKLMPNRKRIALNLKDGNFEFKVIEKEHVAFFNFDQGSVHSEVIQPNGNQSDAILEVFDSIRAETAFEERRQRMNWGYMIEKTVAECPYCFEIAKNLILHQSCYVNQNELFAICLRQLFNTQEAESFNKKILFSLQQTAFKPDLTRACLIEILDVFVQLLKQENHDQLDFHQLAKVSAAANVPYSALYFISKYLDQQPNFNHAGQDLLLELWIQLENPIMASGVTRWIKLHFNQNSINGINQFKLKDQNSAVCYFKEQQRNSVEAVLKIRSLYDICCCQDKMFHFEELASALKQLKSECEEQQGPGWKEKSLDGQNLLTWIHLKLAKAQFIQSANPEDKRQVYFLEYAKTFTVNSTNNENVFIKLMYFLTMKQQMEFENLVRMFRDNFTVKMKDYFLSKRDAEISWQSAIDQLVDLKAVYTMLTNGSPSDRVLEHMVNMLAFNTQDMLKSHQLNLDVKILIFKLYKQQLKVNSLQLDTVKQFYSLCFKKGLVQFTSELSEFIKNDVCIPDLDSEIEKLFVKYEQAKSLYILENDQFENYVDETVKIFDCLLVSALESNETLHQLQLKFHLLRIKRDQNNQIEKQEEHSYKVCEEVLLKCLEFAPESQRVLNIQGQLLQTKYKHIYHSLIKDGNKELMRELFYQGEICLEISFEVCRLGYFHANYKYQFALILIELLFNLGSYHQLCDKFTNIQIEKIKEVNCAQFIDVVIQIFARLSSNKQIGKCVETIMLELVEKLIVEYPQSVINQLRLSIEGCQNDENRKFLNEIKALFQKHHLRIWTDTNTLQDEILKLAISPHEFWSEKIMTIMKNYYDNNEKPYPLMKYQIKSQEDQYNSTKSKSLIETMFDNKWKYELDQLYQLALLQCELRETFQFDRFILEARELRSKCFEERIAEFETIDANTFSNIANQDFEHSLCIIPGTFEVNKEKIFVRGISRNLSLQNSMEKPRHVVLKGSDGNDYEFVLKAHEDFRLDERIMQFLDFLNRLIAEDRNALGDRIRTFAVIPLSNNTAMLRYIGNCDQISTLIKNNRQNNQQRDNVELNIIQKEQPTQEKFTVPQKYELFLNICSSQKPIDLAASMYLRSKNPEAQQFKVLNFTRSLAVMSAVGYLIGLGDRHVSNIMVDKTDGTVLHIDYGDCFDKNKFRKNQPELIPFRFTRMIRQLLGPTQHEGEFRETMVKTMKILRKNKQSILTLLEAFIQDPLATWRDRDFDWKRQTRTPVHTPLGTPRGTPVGTPRGTPRGSVQPMGPRVLLCNEPDGEEKFEFLLKMIKNDQTLSEEGLEKLQWIKMKLQGNDFNPEEYLNINDQVDRLIEDATNDVYLSQCYKGWVPWW